LAASNRDHEQEDDMSDRKPSTIEKVKSALVRTAAEPRKATWIIYGAVGISTLLLFGGDAVPKWPKGTGD
jgi:hypothetical protein